MHSTAQHSTAQHSTAQHSTAQHSTAQRQGRKPLPDLLKGVAIVLVIFTHCIQYGSGDNYLRDNLFFTNSIFKVIYTFHMPLFMLISGYFFFFSTRKYSFRQLITGKIHNIGLPLFFWGMILLLFPIRHLIIEHRLTVTELLTYLSGILWFLQSLLVCCLIVATIYFLLQDSLIAYIVLLAGTFFLPDTFFFKGVGFMYAFFIIAYLFARYREQLWLQKIVASKWTYILATLLFGGLLFFFTETSYIYTSPYSILHKGTTAFHILTGDALRFSIGISGSVLVIGIFRWLGKHLPAWGLRPLIHLGRCSLGLYCISSVGNIILSKLTKGLSYHLPFTVIETVMMIAICLLLIQVIRKKSLSRLLLLGER